MSVAPENIKAFEKIYIGVSYTKVSYTKLGKVTKDGKVLITDNNKKIVETTIKKLHDIYHKFSNSQK